MRKKFAYILMGMFVFAVIILLLLLTSWGWNLLFNIGCLLPGWLVPLLLRVYGVVFVVLTILVIYL